METIEIPAADAKKRLPDYLVRSAHGECRFIVTRRGRPMAALVSIQDLRDLEQMDKRAGLAAAVDKWKGFEEIASNVESARTTGAEDRDVSL